MKTYDIEAICEIANLEKEVRNRLAEYLVAIRNESRYNGGKQENGYISGTAAAIAHAVGGKSETVIRIHKKLNEMDGGGNAALRALPSENPRELIFFSERMKNTLDEMTKTKQERKERRENRQAARAAKQSAAEKSSQTAPDASEAGASPAVGAGTKEEQEGGRLRELQRKRSALKKVIADGYGDEIVRQELDKTEEEILSLTGGQRSETAPELPVSRGVDGTGSAGTGESETRAGKPDSTPKGLVELIPAALECVPVPASASEV
ncbi:MAG: hypothetical protein ACI4P3_04230 [Candidatus Spyradosoma sp.]